ncbi:trace amine-associated receptor 13c-like [Ptychodera flava]|uniref:trace amine-associated receptor 13c-like n=1 Tax=Ptychodera flava TaxID=63121 RepID=UPI00396A7EA7
MNATDYVYTDDHVQRVDNATARTFDQWDTWNETSTNGDAAVGESIIDPIDKPHELFLVIANVIILSLTIIVGGTGNVVVCVLVIFVKKLRTPFNFQIVSLAVADGLVCILASPMFLSHNARLLRHDYYYGPREERACRVQVFIAYVSISISISTLVSLGIARVVALSNKFRPARVKYFIVVCIFISYIIGPIYGYCETDEGHFSGCYDFSAPIPTANYRIKSTVVLVSCFAAIVVSYAIIYTQIRKHQQSVMPSLQNSNSSNSGAVARVDIATAKTASIVTGAFFISFLPFTVYAAAVVSGVAPDSIYISAFFCTIAYSGSALNPVIYSLKSKSFKKYLANLRRCLKGENA